MWHTSGFTNRFSKRHGFVMNKASRAEASRIKTNRKLNFKEGKVRLAYFHNWVGLNIQFTVIIGHCNNMHTNFSGTIRFCVIFFQKLGIRLSQGYQPLNWLIVAKVWLNKAIRCNPASLNGTMQLFFVFKNLYTDPP